MAKKNAFQDAVRYLMSKRQDSPDQTPPEEDPRTANGEAQPAGDGGQPQDGSGQAEQAEQTEQAEQDGQAEQAEQEEQEQEEEPEDGSQDSLKALKEENDNLRLIYQRSRAANQQLKEVLSSIAAQRSFQDTPPVETDGDEDGDGEFDYGGFNQRFYDSDDVAGQLLPLVEHEVKRVLKQLGLRKIDGRRLEALDRYDRESRHRDFMEAVGQALDSLVEEYPELAEEDNYRELTGAVSGLLDEGGYEAVNPHSIRGAALDVLEKSLRGRRGGKGGGDDEVLYERVRGDPELLRKLEQEWLKDRQTKAPVTLGSLKSGQAAFAPLETPDDKKGTYKFAVSLAKKFLGK